jgi:hypothetical protein
MSTFVVGHTLGWMRVFSHRPRRTGDRHLRQGHQDLRQGDENPGATSDPTRRIPCRVELQLAPRPRGRHTHVNLNDVTANSYQSVDLRAVSDRYAQYRSRKTDHGRAGGTARAVGRYGLSFKLDPTNVQAGWLARWAGSRRRCFNHALALVTEIRKKWAAHRGAGFDPELRVKPLSAIDCATGSS